MKKIQILFSVILFTFGFRTLAEEYMTGPVSAIVNQTTTYVYDQGATALGASWEVTGGTVTGTWQNGTTYTANVQWTSAGSRTVKFKNLFNVLESKNVTVIAAPPTPTATQESNKTTSSFRANWNSSSGAESYRLDVSTASNFSSYLSGYQNKTVSGTNQTVSGLSPGKNYYYRVRAYHSAGGGYYTSYSGTITANTTISAPSASQESSKTTSSFRANWGSVTGASTYRLDVSTNNSFSSYVSGYNNLSVTGTNKTVENLDPGKNYFYRVRAVGPNITSSNSGTITANTTIGSPSASQETVKTNDSFQANWGSVLGAVTYRLDVSTSSSFSSYVSGYNNLSVTGTNKTVDNLDAGKNYYYRVRAVGPNITSSNSGTITANTTISAPSASQENNKTTSSFRANWVGVTGASTYRLDVSTSNDFSSFVSGYNNLSVSTTNQTVSNLAPGQYYYYRVRAVGPNITSGNSVTITANTKLAAPVISSETAKTNGSFTANWSPSIGATSYRLYVSEDSDFSTHLSGYNYKNVTGGETSYNVTGLTPGKNYYYRVKARGIVTSAYSSPNTANTTISTPSASQETANANDSFQANWVSVSGAVTYRLDVSTSSGFSSYVSGYQNKSVSGNNHTVSGLAAGKNYYYRVRAVGEDITSGNSGNITANTTISAPSVSQETANANDSFQANWGSVLGASSYRLDVSTTADFSAMVPGYNNLSVSGTSKSVTGLGQPGTNYYYRVRAVGPNITSSNSSGITAHTTISAPSASQESNKTTSSFRANWASVTGATGYRLDVSTSSNFSSYVSGYNDQPVTGTNHTVGNLEPGDKYYYRVRAEGPDITSSNSSTITANTKVATPTIAAETNKTTDSFTANWGAVAGANTYRLYVSEESDFSTHLAGYNYKTVSGTSHTVPNLTPGKNYYYRVKARGDAHTSSYSASNTANTTISAPSASQETVKTTSSFQANWASVTGVVTYRLDVSTSDNFSSFVSGYNNLTVSVTNKEVNNLDPGTKYYYRVRAVGEDITSGNSGSITANTTTPAPSAPTPSGSDCTSKTLTRGNPSDTNITWYWQGTNASGTDESDASSTYTATTTGTYYLRAKSDDGYWSSSSSVSVTTYDALAAGSTGGLQTICYDTTPAQLSSINAATGGTTHNYQWQESPNNVNWTDIPGATGLNYTPGSLTSDMYYRRGVSSTCDDPVYTASKKVTVRDELTAGSIGSDQTLCGGVTPNELTNVSGAQGGDETYTYSWQSSPNGSNSWTTIGGAAGSAYTPAAITADTWIKRVVADGTCGTESSYAVKLTFEPDLTPGTITGDYAFCESGYVDIDFAGEGLFKKWQYKAAGSSQWYDIGTMGQSGITTNHQENPVEGKVIRVEQIGNCNTVYSNEVTTHTEDTPDAGHIIGATEYFNSATGEIDLEGQNSTVITWQQKDGQTWSDVPSSAGLTSLSFSGLTTDREYQVVVGEGICIPDTTEIALVDVTQLNFTGRVSGDELLVGTDTVVLQLSGHMGQVIKWQYMNLSDTAVDKRWKYIESTSTTLSIDTLAEPCYYRALISYNGTNGFSAAHFVDWQPTPDPDLVENNYAKARTVRTSVTDTAQITALNASQKTVTYAYRDGLGRSRQTVVKDVSPGGNDQVGFVEYDHLGRTVRTNLPFTTSGEDYYADPAALLSTFYNGSVADVAASSNPYAETEYEESPLGRVLEQGAPGTSWQLGSGHNPTFDYRYNNTNEVYRWDADGTTNGHYAAASLAVTELTDENGHQVITYTDQYGRTILKKVEAGYNEWLETYSVYDEEGRLVYTLPPKALAKMYDASNYDISLAGVDSLIYQYVYDDLGRLVEKHVPGVVPTYIVYDNLDRALLTQDGNARLQNSWAFVKHDRKNRPLYSGLYRDDVRTTRADMQAYIDSLDFSDPANRSERKANNAIGYTENVFPNQNTEILTINYYDHYDLDRDGTADYAFDALHHQDSTVELLRYTRGLPTATKTRILGSDDWLVSVMFYDRKGRVVQQLSNNHRNLTPEDLVSVAYDFPGQVLSTKSTVEAVDSLVVVNEYDYDDQGRLLAIHQQTQDDPSVQIAAYRYNELGQMVEKKLHSTDGTNFLQSVDYAYNIRGWLKSINDPDNMDANDLWGMKLLHEESLTGLNHTPAYNGNISAMIWSDGTNEKAYSYGYDATDRLVDTDYGEGASFAYNADDYRVSNISYDANGNIQSLTRNVADSAGHHMMDDLTYSYAGNQLMGVSDSETVEGFSDGANTGDDYAYDAMGNMIKDENKGIDTLIYNVLNKVDSIHFSNNRSIKYIYSAAGEKLRLIHYEGSIQVKTKDYIGSIVIEDDTLRQMASAEGRVVFDDQTGDPSYEYHITDHLGNVRATMDENGGVVQSQDYYPFGLTYNSTGTGNNFLYNDGSELNEETDYYETFFRSYDASLGRFMAVDPLASSFSGTTPYNYAFNDPVAMNDPNGDSPRNFNDWWGAYKAFWDDMGGGGASRRGQSYMDGREGIQSTVANYTAALNGLSGFYDRVDAFLDALKEAEEEAKKQQQIVDQFNSIIGALIGFEAIAQDISAFGAFAMSQLGLGMPSDPNGLDVGTLFSIYSYFHNAGHVGGLNELNGVDGLIQANVGIEMGESLMILDGDGTGHPEQINIRKSSKSAVALQLLKGIRHASTNKTKFDLKKLFSCLEKTCLLNPGTHYTFQTSLQFGDTKVPMYLEIPNHGPGKGLVFDPFEYQTNPYSEKYSIRWGAGQALGGVFIAVENKHSSLIMEYLGLR